MESAKCKHCSAVFGRLRSTDRYCSAKCAYSDKKPIKRTAIRKGVSKSNKTFHAVKLEMAEKMIEENGFPQCEHCGIPSQSLDLHHIFYRSEVPNHQHLNNPLNLIWLCRGCHEWFHMSKDNRSKVVDSRGLMDLFGMKFARYSCK